MNWMSQITEVVRSLFKWWFIVLPWEQAVRIRIGKHTRLFGAGLHLFVPFLDRVYKQNTRTRIASLSPQTLTTLDGKTITCVGSVRYKVLDVLKLYQTLHQPESTVCQEVEGLIADYIVTNTVDKCTPLQVSNHVARVIDLSKYGLGETEFFMTEFAVVRTYRLIGGNMERWSGHDLSTNEPMQNSTSS